MTVSRQSLNMVTDTGANASTVSGPLYGGIVQVGYSPADTGVRIDTGAVLTLTADTGGINVPVLTMHLAPNGSAWFRGLGTPVYDTGGGIVSGVTTVNALAGECLKASVQGISTDTGKEVEIYVYTYSG